MRKKVLIFSSLFIILLMISTVTAVPKSQSQPVMDQVKRAEQEHEKYDTLSELSLNGIFNIILQLILAIFNLIKNIFTVIGQVITIIRNMKTLIESIQVLLQQIQDFLDIISNLLNPERNLL